VTGLLVPVRAPERLARAIVALGEDEDRRKAMGAAAVRRARDHFDERRVVGIVLETYEIVAAAKGIDLRLRRGPQAERPR
jgi:glycosyltransferase involved in cell wall biosynthesis